MVRQMPYGHSKLAAVSTYYGKSFTCSVPVCYGMGGEEPLRAQTPSTGAAAAKRSD